MHRFHGGDIRSYETQFHKTPLDFSVNVSPLGLPSGVREAIVRALDQAEEYPDVYCRSLRHALGAYHGVDPDWILCGNGAADLIDRLAFALAQEQIQVQKATSVIMETTGKAQRELKSDDSPNVLLTAPTFTEYRFALERAGLTCISYPLSAENGFAIQEDFIDWITPELAAVFLCEPNNPTGKTTDRKLLIRILEKCRECNARLIIDECFQEFLDEPDAHTMQEYLDEPDAHTMQEYLDEPDAHTMQEYLDVSAPGGVKGCPGQGQEKQDGPGGLGRLLILKSFTKTYAMPGIRLGYCLCSDTDFLDQMGIAAQPWAVSNLAQAAGIAALQEQAYKDKMRALVRTERIRLQTELTEAGCLHVQGEANYLLFWNERTDLAEKLAEQGILIRTCTDYEGLDAHWYRIGIRNEADHAHLIREIRALGGGSCASDSGNQGIRWRIMRI